MISKQNLGANLTRKPTIESEYSCPNNQGKYEMVDFNLKIMDKLKSTNFTAVQKIFTRA